MTRQTVEQRVGGFLIDPHSAIALYVTVTRTGHRPAPGLPSWPNNSCKLTISRTVATECRCWVIPIAQVQITRSDCW